MKIILIITLVLLGLSSKSFADNSVLTVEWNSSEGLKRLESSQFKTDFYDLADHFQPQINPLYCASASSVIILNAINEKKPSQKKLEIKKPAAFGGGNIEFKSYSQLTFFNNKTDKIKNRKIIELKNITAENENDSSNFDAGLSLDELGKILRKIYKLKVQTKNIADSNPKTVDNFRKLAREIAADHEKYLLINFYGKKLGLKTGGHISPLAAFDEVSDSFLILDVAGHKNGWYWVKTIDLVKAMNTKDGKNFRGYLVIYK
ncbi:MAG: hypothetical protein ACJAW3_000111 [Lentimonas sp.]|jgi:hypothetical protein